MSDAAANIMRLDSVKQALGEQARLVRLVDQNPGITAEEKRQLIDSLYSTMIQTARAGNKAFETIDTALAK